VVPDIEWQTYSYFKLAAFIAEANSLPYSGAEGTGTGQAGTSCAAAPLFAHERVPASPAPCTSFAGKRAAPRAAIDTLDDGMKFDIHHSTTYRYARAVLLQSHRMMLYPRNSHDLRVLSTSLRCTPDVDLTWTQDVFGNLIAIGSFAQPASELVIISEVSVEQSAAEWPVFRIAPEAHSYPFDYSADEVTDLGAMLMPENRGQDTAVQSWAQGFVYGKRTDTLSLLKDINTGILGAVAYRARDEEGTQSASETLRIGSGSCRDIAALFLEVVRYLGFGGRAVSGYLYDPDTPVGQAGATHAWAEVYLPFAGWVAFDPTNGRVGGARLIPIAVGRHNQQIMPVTGGYIGAPGDFIGMEVDVIVMPHA
jgi:transglutaminase-like putative cysteine protease